MPLTLKNQPPYYNIASVQPQSTEAGIYLYTMNSIIKVEPISKSIFDTTVNLTLTDAVLRATICQVPKTTLLTGMMAFQVTQGNYTGDNTNAMALYKWDGTRSKLVAQTANDSEMWKATGATWIQKPFTSPYIAQAGIYFMTCLYNNSAQTTAPTIAGLPSLINGSIWASVIPIQQASGYNTISGSATLPANLDAALKTNGSPYLALY